jgi:hypothetical protein
MHPAAVRAIFDEQVAALSPALAQRRQWIFHSFDFPLIDCSFTSSGRTTLRVQFHCDEWNDLPPSISLHAADGAFLTATPPNQTGVFHAGPHPLTNRPFICMRGSREFHTHPSHVSDLWENAKNGSSFTLGGILTQVWHAWQKGTG